MDTKLSWKKGFFDSTYKIYSDGVIIGSLRDRTLSQSADAEFNGKEYTFKTKGFIKQSTQIIDCQSEKVIGEINYNNWMTKANLKILDKNINWKYDNIWNTKWSIFNSEGIQIDYSGSSTSGKIETNTNEGLLLLTGLFVTNYYWQLTITLIIAALVPVWISFVN